MQNIKFGNRWLSDFGGQLTKCLPREIAQRDYELVEIPGKDGADCIDKRRYKNVDMRRKIVLIGSDLEEKAELLIRHFAYKQGYQPFEDTAHPGLTTQAVLINFPSVINELRTLRTAELVFSRLPFWFLKSGLKEVSLNLSELTVSGVKLHNPYPSEAKSVIRFKYTSGTSFSYVRPVINGIEYRSAISAPVTFSSDTVLDYDIDKQHAVFRKTNGEIIGFLSIPISDPLSPGENTIIASFSESPVSVSIIPRWRCL